MNGYICADCDHHVIGYMFLDPGDPVPTLCASCDWIRRHVPPTEQPAIRERMGVPLKEAASNGD